MTSLGELHHAWKRGGVLIGIISATGGFIADVLQPIAPFAQYIFLLSLACTAVALGAYLVVLRKYRPQALTLLVCAVTATLITGGVFAVQHAAGPEQGFLSESVPGVEQLQCSLGLIHDDVRAVKNATAAIGIHTASIVKDTGDIKNAVKDLDQKIDAIGAHSSDGSGIIPVAQKPEDYYHNARIYELGGDYANARKSYEAYIASDAHHVDAHRRFQTLLKIQEGLVGARRVYREMARESEDPIVRFAQILLDDPQAQVAELETYIVDHPDCAPAYYELSLLYSQRVLGVQSVADKKKEKELLNTFLTLLDEGQFFGFYVDKQAADDVVSEAKERFAAIETFGPAALENPVSVVPARDNTGWSLTITVADMATDISYKLGGQDHFTSTGTTPFVSPYTGKPVPRGSFELPADAQAQTIEVKYVDLRGKEHGPFEYHFSPGASLVAGPIQILNMTKTSWISIQSGEPNSLIYFTHLLAFRRGLAEVHYGVNTDIPDKTLSLGPSDSAASDSEDSTASIYVEYPGTIEYAVVQLVFADGTTSAVEKFK